jgi:hypothetical protein
MRPPALFRHLEDRVDGRDRGFGHDVLGSTGSRPLDAVSAGTLRLVEGSWHLDRVAARSAGLLELLEVRLATVGATARAALELVAVAEPIGLRLLHRLVDERVAETLERGGLIVVDHDDRRLPVHVCHPLHAELLGRTTPASARIRYARQLADVWERTGLRRENDLVRWATWRLEGGGPVDRGRMAGRPASSPRPAATWRCGSDSPRPRSRPARRWATGCCCTGRWPSRGASEAADALLGRLEDLRRCSGGGDRTGSEQPVPSLWAWDLVHQPGLR